MKRLKALQSFFVRNPNHAFLKNSSNLPEPTFTPHVVAIAPDKFKGTLTAGEVAGEVGRAVAEAFPSAVVHLYPMADGGEGTASVIAEKMHLQPATCEGHNSLMQPITIEYYQDETVCAVDSAAIIGLPMLGDTPPDPWHSTSYGLGEFISARMAEGKRRIYIGIGGTASIDGGAGMLQALGAVFRDVGGSAIGTHDNPVCAGDLWKIFSTDLTAAELHAVRDSVTGIADVNLPLIPSTIEEVSDMSHMSSLSFACQKGLPQQDLPQLYESLANYAAAIAPHSLQRSRRWCWVCPAPRAALPVRGRSGMHQRIIRHIRHHTAARLPDNGRRKLRCPVAAGESDRHPVVAVCGASHPCICHRRKGLGYNARSSRTNRNIPVHVAGRAPQS